MQVRRLHQLIRHGWLQPDEATKARLLDGTLYLDELDELVQSRCDTDARTSVLSCGSPSSCTLKILTINSQIQTFPLILARHPLSPR